MNKHDATKKCYYIPGRQSVQMLCCYTHIFIMHNLMIMNPLTHEKNTKMRNALYSPFPLE